VAGYSRKPICPLCRQTMYLRQGDDEHRPNLELWYCDREGCHIGFYIEKGSKNPRVPIMTTAGAREEWLRISRGLYIAP